MYGCFSKKAFGRCGPKRKQISRYSLLTEMRRTKTGTNFKMWFFDGSAADQNGYKWSSLSVPLYEKNQQTRNQSPFWGLVGIGGRRGLVGIGGHRLYKRYVRKYTKLIGISPRTQATLGNPGLGGRAGRSSWFRTARLGMASLVWPFVCWAMACGVRNIVHRC